MQKQYKLTKERLEELNKELIYLKTVREPEVAEQIKEARSFGDLSENSEYDEAKNEQGRVFSRIVELDNIISHSVIIEVDTQEPDKVTIGRLVVVQDLETGDREEYTIVGSQEADPGHMRISDESPFGKALMGHSPGDEMFIDVPAGRLHYKLLEIK